MEVRQWKGGPPAVILNVYQSTGIEKEDGSRQSLESHRKLNEIRRFYHKRFEEGHDVHRNLASSGEYSKPNKRGEYQYVSGVVGIAYNPFLDSEAGGAHRNHEVAELLKFWTEKIIEIDTVERERPSLGLILEKKPEVISVPRSSKRVELKMGNGNGMLVTNLGVVWKLLRPSWCPHPHESLIEEVTERVRLAPTEDEDLATLSIVHKLILPQVRESEEESMDETLSETEEEIEVGNTPEPKPAEEDFTAQELLKDLSGDDWADTATPPLTSSPRKNLELPLTGETSNMGMILLSTVGSKKNTFEGNKTMFLRTLEEKAWQEFLGEFKEETKSVTALDDFKEELWNTVVKFGEPVLMAAVLDEKARKELLSKMVKLRETRQKTRDDECKDSSTLKRKTDDKIIESIKWGRIKTSKIIKNTNILKVRAWGRQELEGLDGDKQVESVMITTTPRSRDVKSCKI